MRDVLCPVDDTHRKFRLDFLLVQNPEHLNPGADPKDAIIAATQRQPEAKGKMMDVAPFRWERLTHGIDGDSAAQGLGRMYKPISSLLVGIGQG
ncbi:MAG: hypothetical protein L6R40_008253 [Gallowayella cf. fulva]|nr:MAG: hypothetical protein L6R40_008253 [Xanthomendoza cf. fulva]